MSCGDRWTNYYRSHSVVDCGIVVAVDIW